MCKLQGAPDRRQKHVWVKRQWRGEGGAGLDAAVGLHWSQSSSPVGGASLWPSSYTRVQPLAPQQPAVPHNASNRPLPATQPLSCCEQTRKRLSRSSLRIKVLYIPQATGRSLTPPEIFPTELQFLCNFKLEWIVSWDVKRLTLFTWPWIRVYSVTI